MSVPNERAEGFAVIPNWLARDGSVSPAAKAVYINLSSRTGKDGWCWPSQQTIANETGYATRRVKQAIKELQALGVVWVEVQRTPVGRRNRYLLSMGVVHPSARRVVHPSAQEQQPVEQEPLTGSLSVLEGP